MDRQAWLAATIAGLGIVTMYVDGALLQRGVSTWGQLAFLALGGAIGLGITIAATVRIAGRLMHP
jgi:hypothetical protein